MIPGRRSHQPARVRQSRATRLTLYTALIATAVFAVFPIYWLVISSLKTPVESGRIPATWWPQAPDFHAYLTVFEVVPFGRSFANSVILTVVCSVSVVMTSILSGYVFAKYRFRGREKLFWAIVLTMFLPPITTIVPLYNMMNSWNLNDTFLGLVLPWLANPFGVFLMRQFIADIPDELIDAARVDGASEVRIVASIVTPLLRPAVITLLVFTTVYYWNSFLWPLTILQSTEKFPITVTLAQLLSYNTTVKYQSVVMAGVLVASIPTLLVFLLGQRVFVQGISRTGVK